MQNKYLTQTSSGVGLALGGCFLKFHSSFIEFLLDRQFVLDEVSVLVRMNVEKMIPHSTGGGFDTADCDAANITVWIGVSLDQDLKCK